LIDNELLTYKKGATTFQKTSRRDLTPIDFASIGVAVEKGVRTHPLA